MAPWIGEHNMLRMSLNTYKITFKNTQNVLNGPMGAYDFSDWKWPQG